MGIGPVWDCRACRWGARGDQRAGNDLEDRVVSRHRPRRRCARLRRPNLASPGRWWWPATLMHRSCRRASGRHGVAEAAAGAAVRGLLHEGLAIADTVALLGLSRSTTRRLVRIVGGPQGRPRAGPPPNPATTTRRATSVLKIGHARHRQRAMTDAAITELTRVVGGKDACTALGRPPGDPLPLAPQEPGTSKATTSTHTAAAGSPRTSGPRSSRCSTSRG